MKSKQTNFLIIVLLSLFLFSCGENDPVPGDFILTTTAKKNAVINGGELTLSLKAKRAIEVDSISYTLDDNALGTATQLGEFVIKPKSKTLGHKNLKAVVHVGGGQVQLSETIILLNNEAPKIFTYKIINRFPHQTDAYTQGLEFVGDELYESTGQYGMSKLRKVDYTTGEVQKEITLDNAYFAEGLTVLNDHIYQLTWKENTGFIYNKNSLEKTGTFAYNKSTEGWGLCNNGQQFFKSDGTSKIWTLDPENLQEQTYIEPTDHRGVKSKFNELEWIDGKIYANTYQVASIAIINPQTGAIEGIVDLRSIVNEVQDGLDKANEVLNGIAYKNNEDRLFVTGKHWNTLFEIEIVDK